MSTREGRPAQGARKRVLVLGGGIAGIEVATRLGRARRRNGLHVILADRSTRHVWKPMLHRFAAGTSLVDRQAIPFLGHAAANGYRFELGSLDTLDRERRVATLAPLPDQPERVEVHYDALVLALGSRANDFGTPGVSGHCDTIDDLADAEAFHARFRDRMIAAHARGEVVRIAIVGGGATGVELAAELKQAADRLVQLRSGQPVELCLIETGKRLLPHFPDEVAQAATRTLQALGVSVRTGTKVVRADEGGFELDGGGRIEAAIRVWAAGVKAPEAMGQVGLACSRAGEVEVGADLRPPGSEAVFALGDCAHCKDADGKPVPATAQAARQQAIHLSRHLAGALSGGTMPPFRYDDRGSIVSLGDYNGWGTLGHYQFGGGRTRGLAARAAHALLYRQHQIEVLGTTRGLRTWLSDVLSRTGRTVAD